MHKSLASRLIAGALAALLVSLLVLAVPAPAFAWTVDTSTRTEAEMRARWEQLKPTYAGTPYAVTPSFTAPYVAGDAAPGFRADGLGIINFARYLSGLPSDVTLSATRNNAGQHGAVLLRVIAFSHA
ncbi:hypothetical protein EG835_09475, partial [bacterium]|nr:hypothetical protein [bacterium]